MEEINIANIEKIFEKVCRIFSYLKYIIMSIIYKMIYIYKINL